MNSLYLGAGNQFLDYHTGNRIWQTRIRDVANTVSRNGMSSCYSSSTLSKSPLLDVLAGQISARINGKFLLQSPELGSFIELTSEEAQRATRRRFMTESSPMFSMLDKSLSFMISELLFESPVRETVLASVAAGVLELLRESIFGEAFGRPNMKRLRRELLISERELRLAVRSTSKTVFQLGGLSHHYGKVLIHQTVPRYPSLAQNSMDEQQGAQGVISTVPKSHSSPSKYGNGKRKVDGKRVVSLNKSKRRRK